MSKPQKRTSEHLSWMIQQIISVSEKCSIPIMELSRAEFLRSSTNVSRTDVDACMLWTQLRRLAATKKLSTGRKLVEKLPLEPVPDGYFVKSIATQLDAEGNVEKQWLRAPLEQAAGSLTDQVPEGHSISGVSTLVSGDGHTLAQWTKTKAKSESPEELLLRLLKELPEQVPTRKGSIPKTKGDHRADLLSVYPLGDPHIGCLTWAPETGADFDLGIAEDLMVGAMRDLVLRGPRTKRAMIINLGDYFHYDGASLETTKGGNRLDVDGRSAKVMAVGLRIMHTLIDTALEHHDEVLVDNRIGNHDGHTSLMLSLALASYYRNEPRVTIPPTIKHRSYYEFGKVMIGTTHGDKAKGQDLEALMASEEPEMWGRTKYRYILCGHVHHQSVKEYRGCKVESFRTLAGRDSWHAGQGYTAGRDLQRIVYNLSHGEVSRETVNVSALLSK